MDILINKLCIKRLCLPTNTNIYDLKYGLIKKFFNESNISYHIACIFNGNNILSYGINKYYINNTFGTTHAEFNALNNLYNKSKNKKHLKNIDLLVIRMTLRGKLCLSKPCLNCILNMINLPKKKGYIIKNIYYSDSNGNIIMTTLNKLYEDDNYHITKYYKKYYNTSINI